MFPFGSPCFGILPLEYWNDRVSAKWRLTVPQSLAWQALDTQRISWREALKQGTPGILLLMQAWRASRIGHHGCAAEGVKLESAQKSPDLSLEPSDEAWGRPGQSPKLGFLAFALEGALQGLVQRGFCVFVFL